MSEPLKYKAETAARANTAARVGGLFDDLADTATLDRERGVANLYLDESKSFTPTQGQAVKLTTPLKSFTPITPSRSFMLGISMQ